MSTIEERCYGHESAATSLMVLREEKRNLITQIGWIEQARLQDAKDHEQAMRVLIKMLCKRGDIIGNQKSRADNWQKVAIAANRKIKILESKIRHDDRSFAKVKLCKCK